MYDILNQQKDRFVLWILVSGRAEISSGLWAWGETGFRGPGWRHQVAAAIFGLGGVKCSRRTLGTGVGLQRGDLYQNRHC